MVAQLSKQEELYCFKDDFAKALGIQEDNLLQCHLC